MNETYRLYPNVELGPGVQIDDFCIIGVPPRGCAPGELRTVIGGNSVIRSHTVIYAGNVIGDAFQSGHGVLIRELNQIGRNVSIGSHCVVEHHCTVGDGVRIQGNSGICEYSVLEDECWIGPYVVFTNTLHPTCPNVKECIKGPTIKRRAIIAGRVSLAPAVVVGERAFVGLGCNVTSDVPAGKFVVGYRPRPIGNVADLTCPYGIVERPYPE